MKRANKIKSIGFITIIGLVTAIYFLVWMPYRADIQQAKDDVTYQAETNDRIYAENQRLKKIATLVPSANAYDEELMKRFPATSDAQNLRAAIMQTAIANNITGLSIDLTVPNLVQAAEAPQTQVAPESATDDPNAAPASNLPQSTSKNNLAYQTVSLTGEGSITDVSRFLQGLENVERALIVTKVSVSNSDSGSSFSATAYSYIHAATVTPGQTGNDQEAPITEPAPEQPVVTP